MAGGVPTLYVAGAAAAALYGAAGVAALYVAGGGAALYVAGWAGVPGGGAVEPLCGVGVAPGPPVCRAGPYVGA
ncbi:hypothetical protein GCM10009558_090910 [Virgisporangium aurantiacum]